MVDFSRLPLNTTMLYILVVASTMCNARHDKGFVVTRHRDLDQPRSHLSLAHHQPTILLFRGGQAPTDPYSTPTNQPYQSLPKEYNTQNGFGNYNTPADIPDTDHLFQESVQERVDKWRQAQISQSQNLTPEQERNPRDSQGRMKLLASVSRGSRALIFFMIMWRDIHLFELADQSLKGTKRLVVVVPLILLFIGNMAGVAASFTSPSHSSKKRMKAILNLDKLVEGILLVWYFFRLTVFPSKYVPREVFVAKTLHSVIFLVQLQAFTRVTW